MTPNLPGTCPRARWSVTYGNHVAPRRRFSSRLSLGNRSFPTLPLEELHTDSRCYEPEDQRQASGFLSIFKCQHFPISESRQMVADSAPSRKRNIPKSFVRKSSTVEQRASEKQPYATGWHCALLSKLPRGNRHFVGMFHPSLAKVHPFFSIYPAPQLDALTLLLIVTWLSVFTPHS